MPRLLEHVNFPKIVTVLAVTFGVALGACGLTALVSSRGFGGQFAMPLAMLELAVMLLSAIGLLITVVVWVMASALGRFRHEEADPQRLLEREKNDGDK